MRRVVTASAILFLLISSAALDGQGQNFVLVEESRLPADRVRPEHRRRMSIWSTSMGTAISTFSKPMAPTRSRDDRISS